MPETLRCEPVDVAVVGAGLAGAAFTARLAEQAPQLRILCLERGGWVDPASMPAASRHWQRAAVGAWATSPNLRLAAGGNPFSADYAIDDSASAIKPLMWSGVGGSTISWAAHFPRLHPSDFRTRSLDGVGEDWPYGYDELAPYYDLNDAMMGVSGLAGDPAYPPKPARPQPPLALGRLGLAAARGFDRLGWHWWPVDAAINSRGYGGRPGCNHCGPCLNGCISRAKASVDVTHWPKAIAAGVELRPHAVVEQVLIEGGRATAVLYRGADGRQYRQPAGRIVIAGNGIGTARLLLASGVASPALGRHLMYHPVAYARGMFAEPMDGPAGPVGCSIYSHEFYETDERRGFKRGIQLQVTRENALLIQALRLEQSWGTPLASALREEFHRSIVVMAVAEDLPEPENRVILGAETAPDGLPAVKVEYRVSDAARRMLDFGLDRAEEVLRAAGAHRVVRMPLAPFTGWHLLGTARMGPDPATAVTDAHGCCHAVQDLMIVDGSLFPTVGAVNPGSTIGALALKLADDFAREAGA